MASPGNFKRDEWLWDILQTLQMAISSLHCIETQQPFGIPRYLFCRLEARPSVTVCSTDAIYNLYITIHNNNIYNNKLL